MTEQVENGMGLRKEICKPIPFFHPINQRNVEISSFLCLAQLLLNMFVSIILCTIKLIKMRGVRKCQTKGK